MLQKCHICKDGKSRWPVAFDLFVELPAGHKQKVCKANLGAGFVLISVFDCMISVPPARLLQAGLPVLASASTSPLLHHWFTNFMCWVLFGRARMPKPRCSDAILMVHGL